MLLLIKKCRKVIATQNVCFLFEGDATGKPELHQLLFKRAMRCLDYDRARSR